MRLADDFDEALDAQDVVRVCGVAQAVDQPIRVASRGNRDDEGVEIVVIVPVLGVVMRRPRGEIVLGRRPDAEQHVRVDDALAGRRDLDRSRDGAGDLVSQRREPLRRDQVGLVEDDEIGAQDLVLVDLLERIVVVERRIGGALRGDARRIVGEAAFRDRGGVHDRDDAVDREPGPELGPVEGLDERLRQREARRLDDDVVGLRIAREQRRDGGRELVGDRAADAAVGELDDRLARTGFVGAGFDRDRRPRRRRRTR